MTITKRTLEKWRKEAFTTIKNDYGQGLQGDQRKFFMEGQERILRMTQELLDQHLIGRK